MDFNAHIERRGTGAIKYNTESRQMPPDVIPLWVADMDFAAPNCVCTALQKRVEHGIFGYTQSGDGYFAALHGWMHRRFGYSIRPEWVVQTPGVVFALYAAVRALTEPGDAVIIQEPVYYPFAQAVKATGRRLVSVPLRLQNGRYEMDLQGFAENATRENAKLFILCSPHNPVGRVWEKEELLAVGDICERLGMRVISDEIHADFIFPGHTHRVFAALKPSFAQFTVTCTAPSKTFNLAGLHAANIFAENPEIKKKLEAELRLTGYSLPNLMGIISCQAAYEGGEPWLTELLAYLKGNLDFLSQRLSEIPGVSLVRPEGTYLAWLDFRALSLTDAQLNDFLINSARLWLSPGTAFGRGGELFQRLNFACPRPLLATALERLSQAVAARS